MGIVDHIEPRFGAKKAIFLDRDGVINRKLPEDHYVSTVQEFSFLPGVFEALKALKQLGFLLIVVTNQRGVARGFMTEDDLSTVHQYMCSVLKDEGSGLDAVYHCPHEKFENCTCRKPEPGMITTGCEDFNINISESYMVGDSESDVQAGRRAGLRTVHISSHPSSFADLSFSSLLDFVSYLHGLPKKQENE